MVDTKAEHSTRQSAGPLGCFLGNDLVTFVHKPGPPGHPHSDALDLLGTCLKCVFQGSPEIPVQWSGVGPRHQCLSMFSRCFWWVWLTDHIRGPFICRLVGPKRCET